MPSYIVTGCQRSGTHYLAKWLAMKFGLYLILEEDFGVHEFARLLVEVDSIPKEKENDFVIQCPALKHEVELLRDCFPEAEIIWMKRSPKETIASMQRIQWRHEVFSQLQALWPVAMDLKILTESDWEDLYGAMTFLSARVGLELHKRGEVTLVDMETLKDRFGFEKNTGRSW